MHSKYEELKTKKEKKSILRPKLDTIKEKENKSTNKLRGRRPKDCYKYNEDGTRVLIPEFQKLANEINSDQSKINYSILEKDLIFNDFFKKWFKSIFPKKRPNNSVIIPFILKERSEAEIRALKNEATISSGNKCIFVNKKVSKMKFKGLNWAFNDKLEFKRNFEIFGKNFFLISKMINKPIKECIRFYYFTKKKVEYKKKQGRLSDEQLKILIESNYTKQEMKLISDYIKQNNGNISKLNNIFTELKNIFTEKDIKLFYRYYVKYLADKKQPKQLQKRIIEDPLKILKSWSIDERQLFAIYYPYFHKSWVYYTEHIKSKKIPDFTKYFKYYFKKLNNQERLFETYLTELEFNKYLNRYVGKKVIKKKETVLFIDSAGILFNI